MVKQPIIHHPFTVVIQAKGLYRECLPATPAIKPGYFSERLGHIGLEIVPPCRISGRPVMPAGGIGTEGRHKIGWDDELFHIPLYSLFFLLLFLSTFLHSSEH